MFIPFPIVIISIAASVVTLAAVGALMWAKKIIMQRILAIKDIPVQKQGNNKATINSEYRKILEPKKKISLDPQPLPQILSAATNSVNHTQDLSIPGIQQESIKVENTSTADNQTADKLIAEINQLMQLMREWEYRKQLPEYASFEKKSILAKEYITKFDQFCSK